MAAADEAPLRRAGRSCASRLFTDAQFRDFTFVNPALLRARMNPDFFKAPLLGRGRGGTLLDRRLGLQHG
jgi:hypothetical protein